MFDVSHIMSIRSFFQIFIMNSYTIYFFKTHRETKPPPICNKRHSKAFKDIERDVFLSQVNKLFFICMIQRISNKLLLLFMCGLLLLLLLLKVLTILKVNNNIENLII